MASYIYSKVQEAIGGKSITSGFQKGWSPNKIRALYIMRDFILVVDYLSGPKLTKLDMTEAGLDLQNPNRVGSLNNLLSSRQLSCLEEIYADEAFSRFPNVIDLQAYANSVMNSQSRLRYYAYTSGIDGEELRKAYYQAFVQGMPDFTYAKNIGGIRYVDTGNKDWYLKHNLRPQYYGPDADGGSLASWFNKVEKTYAKVAEENSRRDKLAEEQLYILERVQSDIVGMRSASILNEVSKYCSGSSYGLHRYIVSAIKEGIKVPEPVHGLSEEKLFAAVQSAGRAEQELVNSVKKLSSLYSAVGVFAPNGVMDVKKLKETNKYPVDGGFLQAGNMCDRVMAKVYEQCGNDPMYKYTLVMAIVNEFQNGIPNGLLAKRLNGKLKVIDEPLSRYVNEYIRVICWLAGVSEEFMGLRG